VHTELDRRPIAGTRPADWRDLAPAPAGVETYSDAQIDALRRGDLGACFGPAFAALGLRDPVGLPGGRMKLLDRVTHLDAAGGRFGMGLIRADLDIDPSAWFLVCHFSDDRVMPGTLMYECCLHTLRVLLMRLGWVCESDGVAYQPVIGQTSRLKCRGQVIETTRTVTYEVSIRELGYDPEPTCIADALMYADGKPIVEMTGMSVRMTGVDRAAIEALWDGGARADAPASAVPYDHERILAFCVGKPSVAFGDRYLPFDGDRFIARLPAPPYNFLQRVTEVRHEPWSLQAGGSVTAEYDVPPDAWYFASDRQAAMPFAVLLEIPLQVCGWFAAYMGSALTSDGELRFRNLGGRAVQHAPVLPDTGTLTSVIRCTSVSRSGGMIIQNFEYEVRSAAGPVYAGDTYFGFFSNDALADQVGMREAPLHEPSAEQRAGARSFPVPRDAPFPDGRWRMVDLVETYLPDGGEHGLGYVRGGIDVDPSAWFFAAHFVDDPVWPGSLGLEAMLQLMKVLAAERWGADAAARFEAMAPGREHRWTYRGQVIPPDSRVTVEATVTSLDEAARTLVADGLLAVDGRIIYEMSGFSLRMTPGTGS
jgi:3-hydroxymyristoyl/3-hydroxydecanoyl-(acyl carrier protein) dehydratase